ncbi:signal peptide peptidase-like 2B [Haemaphysalis longicornis]
MERCDNSSNDDIVLKAKSAKAAAIVMVFNEKRPIKETTTTIKKVDIVITFLKNSTGRQIAQFEERNNGSLMAKIFTRPTTLDWSFLVIWLMAVATVSGGAYWSGIALCAERPGTVVHSLLLTRPSTFSVDVRYKPKDQPQSRPEKKPKISKRLRKPSEPNKKPNQSSSVGVPTERSDFTDSMAEMEEEFAVPVSSKVVLMFVMHMSVMLLVLYYFYRYLVHAIVLLFAMASAAALVSCLEPLVNRINIGTSKVPERLAVCCSAPMEMRQVALLALGFCVSAAWFVTRHNEACGWVLQDLLGIAFCLNMLKSVHLPNLRLLSLLLMLLLIYDVFFVFITPLLRANRESVMVEVAKGGGVMEVLPMVVKFPRLYRAVYHQCFPRRFSILGLGDILAPGLLISYCHAFDLLAHGRRFYFYIACISYGLGMAATFAALELMRNAQPALLYLVPFTLLPTITAAWCNGELHAIWNGVRMSKAGQMSNHPGKDNKDTRPQTGRDNHTSAAIDDEHAATEPEHSEHDRPDGGPRMPPRRPSKSSQRPG